MVDVCATGLADAATYKKGAFESDNFAAAEPPVLGPSLTPPRTKAFGFLEQKDPDVVRREAQHEAAFEATRPTGSSTKRGKLRRMRWWQSFSWNRLGTWEANPPEGVERTHEEGEGGRNLDVQSLHRQVHRLYRRKRQ